MIKEKRKTNKETEIKMKQKRTTNVHLKEDWLKMLKLIASLLTNYYHMFWTW